MSFSRLLGVVPKTLKRMGTRGKALATQPSVIRFEPFTKDIKKRARLRIVKESSPDKNPADPELRVPRVMRRVGGPTEEEINLLRKNKLLRTESIVKKAEDFEKLDCFDEVAAAALLKSHEANEQDFEIRKKLSATPVDMISGVESRKLLRQVVPESSVLRLITQESVAKFLANKRFVGSGRIRDELKKSLSNVAASLKFAASAKFPEEFYDVGDKREIAFIGRSNVGKSMLINTLFSTGYAKVDDCPGVTQSIDWYEAGPPLDSYVVDMPGYGFAYVDDLVHKTWKPLIYLFLIRPSLARLFLLIDARRGMRQADREFIADLPPNVKLSVVLSKCDLVEKLDLARRYQLLRQELRIRDSANCDIFMVSATMGSGIQTLRNALATVR